MNAQLIHIPTVTLRLVGWLTKELRLLMKVILGYRSQLVKIDSTSSTLLTCLFIPLLPPLLIHDCVSKHHKDETAYRYEVRMILDWCNDITINNSKMVIMDFRRQQVGCHTPLSINMVAMGWVPLSTGKVPLCSPHQQPDLFSLHYVSGKFCSTISLKSWQTPKMQHRMHPNWFGSTHDSKVLQRVMRMDSLGQADWND